MLSGCFPGAAQHVVVRCRPGIEKIYAVPHLRCTAGALHRVRDTKFYPLFLICATACVSSSVICA
jgi:hypothetical protein